MCIYICIYRYIGVYVHIYILHLFICVFFQGTPRNTSDKELQPGMVEACVSHSSNAQVFLFQQ